MLLHAQGLLSSPMAAVPDPRSRYRPVQHERTVLSEAGEARSSCSSSSTSSARQYGEVLLSVRQVVVPRPTRVLRNYLNSTVALQSFVTAVSPAKRELQPATPETKPAPGQKSVFRPALAGATLSALGLSVGPQTRTSTGPPPLLKVKSSCLNLLLCSFSSVELAARAGLTCCKRVHNLLGREAAPGHQ